MKSSFWNPPGQPQKPESPPRPDSRFREHERAGISHCQTPLRSAEHRGRLSVCLPARDFLSPPLRWTLHPPTRSLFFSALRWLLQSMYSTVCRHGRTDGSFIAAPRRSHVFFPFFIFSLPSPADGFDRLVYRAVKMDVTPPLASPHSRCVWVE